MNVLVWAGDVGDSSLGSADGTPPEGGKYCITIDRISGRIDVARGPSPGAAGMI